MNKVFDVIGGIGLLIMLYLVLINGKQTTSIINSLASNSVKGIKTLQGR